MRGRPGSEVPAGSPLGVSTSLLSLEVGSPWFSLGDDLDLLFARKGGKGKGRCCAIEV